MTPGPDAAFEIDGHTLRYPTSFRDGSSMMATFAVPTRSANALIESSGFEVAEIAPRRAVLGINCVHYTDTDCGVYEEVAFSFFVKPIPKQRRVPYASLVRDLVRGDVASHTWSLGVTTTLSRDAGLRMWGFPKQLADLAFDRSGDRATMQWTADGAEVMKLSVPAIGRRSSPPISPPVYSVLDGRPHVGHLTQSYTDVGYHRRNISVTVGDRDHPVAAALRSLGLPRRPLIAIWNGHLKFEMSAPRPL